MITNFELATNLVKLQGFPAKQATFETVADIGGEIQTPDGEVTIALTNAVHSSSVQNPNAGANQAERDDDVSRGEIGEKIITVKQTSETKTKNAVRHGVQKKAGEIFDNLM